MSERALIYTPVGWVDELTQTSAANFNQMEKGIVDAHARASDAGWVADGCKPFIEFSNIGPLIIPQGRRMSESNVAGVTTDIGQLHYLAANASYTLASFPTPAAGTGRVDSLVAYADPLGGPVTLLWVRGADSAAANAQTRTQAPSEAAMAAAVAAASGVADRTWYLICDVQVTRGVGGGVSAVQAFDRRKVARSPIQKVSDFATVGAPSHGEVVEYQDANMIDPVGAVWSFRYNALSASAYKWEFVGGGWMTSHVIGETNYVSTAYGDAGTAPALFLTCPGDYLVNWGFTSYSASLNVYQYGGIRRPGAASAVDADAIYQRSPNTSNQELSTSVQRRLDALATGTLSLQMRNGVTTSASGWSHRSLSLQPIRVAPPL